MFARHTAATVLGKAGANVFEVAAVLRNTAKQSVYDVSGGKGTRARARWWAGDALNGVQASRT